MSVGNFNRTCARWRIVLQDLQREFGIKGCAGSGGGEQIAEALLEGLVLGGPAEQRLCSGDPWNVLGQPNDLRVMAVTDVAGQLQLQAQIKGRSSPLTLLTVTEADAQLHGLSRPALAERWRQVLQRRLRHARFTEQAGQVSLRLKVLVISELLLAASSAGTLWLWARLRRRLQRRLEPAENTDGRGTRRDRWLQWLLRLCLIHTIRCRRIERCRGLGDEHS